MYSEDKRKGLNEVYQNYQLTLGSINYCILTEVGRGGNAIVYEAMYTDNHGNKHNVLIKELFPCSSNNIISRNESGELHIDDRLDNQSKIVAGDYFRKQKNSFERGNRKNSELLNTDPNNVMGNRDIYEENNTLYSIHDMVIGKTLRKILSERNHTNELCGLRSITYIIINMLKALRIFHRNNELHLDISPDNIFVCDVDQSERLLTDEMRKVILLDYNSTWNIVSDFNDKEFYFTTKYGYSAFELRALNKNKVNQATDLFSVCAVFFEMLQDRVQEHEDRTANNRTIIDLNNIYCKSIPETAVYLCNKILRKGLKNSNNKRYQTIEELLVDLIELIRRIDNNAGITHNSLWEGSREYFKTFRELNSIKRLRINDEICESEFFDIYVRLNGGKKQILFDSIFSLWKNANWHVLIKGEGGMGKTVSLISLWQYLIDKYDEDMPVPIYISLSEYNTIKNKLKKESFILDSISKYYLKKSVNRRKVKDALWKKFQEPNNQKAESKPSFILMLDGLNEINIDFELLITELNVIINNFVGVQIILTSRIDIRSKYNLSYNSDNDGLIPLKKVHEIISTNSNVSRRYVNLIELQKLDYEVIYNFFISKRKKIPSGKLLELIGNPMMFAIYSKIYDKIDVYKNNSEFDIRPQIESAGELMWNFIQCQIVKKFELYNNTEQKHFIYFKFIYQHILPFIAYEMVENETFSFKEAELVNKINCYFKSLKKKNFLLLPFSKGGYYRHKGILDLNILTQYEYKRFNNIIRNNISMIFELHKGNYTFIHQNFRDFFAAAHIINEIEYGLSTSCIPNIINKSIKSSIIKEYIGEIVGEHYNIPLLIQDEWKLQINDRDLLVRLLELCKGIFDGSTCKVVLNIAEIWKMKRNDLSGTDFTEVDMSEVNLNSVVCNRWNKDRYLTAKFNRSKIIGTNIITKRNKLWVKSVTYSYNGDKILASSYENSIKEWDIKTGDIVSTYLGHDDLVVSAIYSVDNKKILSTSFDNSIREWNVENEKCLKVFKGHKSKVSSAVYSHDGKKILSASSDNTIKEWSTETGECLYTYEGHNSGVNTAIYSQDGKKILSASSDNTIKEWDVITGECIRTYEGHNSGINSAVYSQDGKKILSASSDNTIKEWSIVAGECLYTYEGHKSGVNTAIYSQDGEKIISSSYDNSIKEWDVKKGNCIKDYEAYSNDVKSAIFSQKDDKILIASCDNSIKEWDRLSEKCIHVYIGHISRVSSALYNKNCKTILSASYDKTIKEWDVENGKCIMTYIGHIHWVRTATYNLDYNKILSASFDKSIIEWDRESGKPIIKYEEHTGVVMNAIYSDDSMKILSCSLDGSIKEWSVGCKKSINTYIGHTRGVNSIQYSSDNKRVLSASFDKTIRVWDIKSKKCLKVYSGHISSVNSAIYNKENNKILSASSDGTIKEWDVVTGRCIRTLKGHLYGVNSAFYNKDEKIIISASSDGTVKEWDVGTGECVRTYENVSGVIIQNCTFNNLHNESEILGEYEVLKKYGAIIGNDYLLTNKI